MACVRSFASTAFSAITLVLPAAAHAQGSPGVPLPDPPPAAPAGRFPGVPLPPLAEAPPPSPPEVRAGPRWYGWHVLLPTGIFDSLVLAGVASLSGSGGLDASLAVGLTGLLGHALSGPIVHLAHRHPLRALASFGVEAVLPSAVIAAALSASCSLKCNAPANLVFIAAPISFTAGTAIDAAAISWEDTPPQKPTTLSSITLIPLSLSPPRGGQAPRPVGAALAGTF